MLTQSVLLKEMRRFTGLQAAGVLATLAIFAVIAVLQSRWIAQLGDAELQRARASLQTSVKTIRTDVNRELMTAFALFQLEPGAPQAWGEMTAEAFTVWRQKARYPDLVRRLLVVEPPAPVSAYNPETRQYAPIDWPPELDDLRKQLALPFAGFGVFGVRTFTGVVLPASPALVVPMIPTREGRLSDATGWVVIELDRQLLLTKILPEIMRQDISQPEQFDYQITRDGFPSQIIYRSNPKVMLSKIDAASSLLELGPQYFPHGIGGNRPRPQRWFSSNVRLSGVPPAPRDEGGIWQLQLQHRAGSLEAAATSLRRGNLLLSFVMLALVAGDLAVLALMARRAHRLGTARLEFAAAVSHELRTPLAAICSAADNLAAGVAYEPSRVQQYGAAILHQGKQLSGMVEQILAFAGGQFRKKHYDLEVVDLGPVVIQAVATVAPAARDAGVEIEAQVPQDLPQVLGDVPAIQQALVNLLINASKYAAAGGWIGVSICNASAGEVEIRVEDKGPGIPAGERRHIFEPFYRGSAAAKANSHGAGLGLTIVDQIAQAHSGRVTVASAPGRGTCFTLHLPTI